MTAATVLGRFTAERLRALLQQAEVVPMLEARGFTGIDVVVDASGRALPHIYLYGEKRGDKALLLDACLGEAVVREAFFLARGFVVDRPLDFTVVHWLCEQDPTVGFSSRRPALPLQRHPGLGILRHAFRALIHITQELGKDGIVNVPKFFHDALIFYHSRLFLFLDGGEQGRFEALANDLKNLPMGEASLAVVSGAVRDADGSVRQWTPGYQVYPLSDLLTAYFHSPQYAAEVTAGRASTHVVVDAAVVRQAQALLAAADN